MRYYTYRTKAAEMSHSELVSLAVQHAGEGDWSVSSVSWYGDDDDERATVDLTAPDLPPVETLGAEHLAIVNAVLANNEDPTRLRRRP